MRKRSAAILLAGLLACSNANRALAAVFGIAMGTATSKLKILDHQSGTDIYRVTVPLPNSEFYSYRVMSTKKNGVCKLVAFGRKHKNDPDGVYIRQVYNTLKQALSAKYGSSESRDAIRPGSIWNEAGDWAAAVSHEDRFYSDSWEKAKGSNLTPDLSNVLLDVEADDSSTTYVNLYYEFTNFGDCQKSLDAANNKGL